MIIEVISLARLLALKFLEIDGCPRLAKLRLASLPAGGKCTPEFIARVQREIDAASAGRPRA